MMGIKISKEEAIRRLNNHRDRNDNFYSLRWLDDAPEEIRSDKEVMMLAVKVHGAAFMYAFWTLWDDEELAKEAVSRHGDALFYASTRLQAKKDVVLLAVKQNGDAISYASQKLSNSKEVALLAVQNGSFAFKYVSRRLQKDPDVVFAAAKRIIGDKEFDPKTSEEELLFLVLEGLTRAYEQKLKD